MKLRNINMLWVFLFAVAFATVYFFVATSFFQGWQKAKFFDDIPDLLIFILMFTIFIYAFRLKKSSAKKYIILGTGLICLQRLVEIPLQEYQAIVGVLSVIFWILPIILWLSGISLLFLGFKEVIK